MEIPEELKILQNIEGISITDGLNFCGSSKAFLKFLNTFYNSIDYKSKEIQDAFEKDDIEFYTIKVHALKSTSRIIGASELSELALSLEEAGKSKDKEYINRNTEKLLNLYRSYLDSLSVLGENDENKSDPRKEIDGRELTDAYNALKEVIPAMDYDAVEMILNGLEEYKLPKEDQEKTEKLRLLLGQMEWEAMEKMLD
ncbi:Hpt domain-containing protein [Butyrivibrio sp. VCB2006]|uniref:Hpt domain-containing protein n=1 Tax=Butyrivibrio sp. VCB2006 TaxID=1280679 RepID=UPI000403A856|nr:Hpt domain-containing protein [Butyrivibrio sp. VCB2006]